MTSLPPLQGLTASESMTMLRSDMAFLSHIGSLTFGSSCTVYLPEIETPNLISKKFFNQFVLPVWFSFSRKTWKHSLTVFKSIDVGWFLWLKPAEKQQQLILKSTQVNTLIHTFKRIYPNLLPNPESFFNVLLLDALDAQIRKGNAHSFRWDLQRAHPPFATLPSNQLVGMGPEKNEIKKLNMFLKHESHVSGKRSKVMHKLTLIK